MKFTYNPPLWREFWRDWLGEKRSVELDERFNRQIKYTDADRRDILAHFNSELKRMLEERADGVMGRLILNPFD